MAITINIAHKNTLVNAAAAVFVGGTVEIRAAPMAAVDAAATGTLLVTLSVPNPAFAAAVSGVAAKAGVWQGVAVAAGVPASFRLKNAAGTEIRQGTAGEAGTDMIITGLLAGSTVVGGNVTATAYSLGF